MDRSELSNVLHELIKPYIHDCNKHVFFQSPSSHKMTYPSIIYTFNGFNKLHADNGAYKLYRKYNILLITDDPDSELIEEIEKLKMCSLDRPYVANNLYHYNYTIYC